MYSNWLQLKTRSKEGDMVVMNSLIKSRETEISFAPWCYLSDADEIPEIKEGSLGMVLDVSQVIEVYYYEASKGDFMKPLKDKIITSTPMYFHCF